MKSLAALSLATVLVAGSMTGAGAFVHPWIGMESATVTQPETNVEPTHYDDCHGRVAGTAHRRCGTATGGPSGGLF